jgi:putative FmdB family regulatory protein
MPIYEYQCGLCGHRLETLQKLSEEPLTHCPACGRAGLQKMVSAAGFRLKGSGWYATDFKDGGKKKSGDNTEASNTTGAAPEGTPGEKNAAAGGTETAKTAEAKP